MSIQILKAGSKNKFKPHIAVCHMSEMVNGGSANQENIPLVMKAKDGADRVQTVLKALGSNADILEKASYRNLRMQLSAALETKMREDNPTKDYVWVDVEDFDETTVVFYFDGNTWSSGYSVSESGIVEISGEVQVAISHQVYTTQDGTDLVLKGAEVSESEEAENEDTGENTEPEQEIEGEVEGEASDDNKDNEENIMSDQNKEVKTEAEVADIVAKALSDAKAQWEADAAKAELEKSTTEIVKSFGEFVAEEDVPAVVKALVGMETPEVIVKALESAKELVVKAQEEVEAVKEEFGSAPQVSDESAPTVEKGSLAAKLQANIKKVKA
ncbi:hypothetical protein [Vibrio phage RYC]|nr:hypothetical protein [Vibrio phage RYC]